MSKEFIPFLTHSEITNEIYIVYGKGKKVCVTDQVVKAMKETGRLNDKTIAEWIKHSYEDEITGFVHILYECNKCNGFTSKNTKYCPNCGAKMEGSGKE